MSFANSTRSSRSLVAGSPNSGRTASGLTCDILPQTERVKDMARRYWTQPTWVEAVQYTPETCREIHEMLGIAHDDDADCESGIEANLLTGRLTLNVGEWCVKDAIGNCDFWDDESFKQAFVSEGADSVPKWMSAITDRVLTECYRIGR